MKTIKNLPFLASVINHLNASNHLGKRLVILPAALSIDYFRAFFHHLKWPDGITCLTLHQLILAHSSLKLLPTTALLSRLYRSAEQILNRKESFEEFCSGGGGVLEDFNTIDTHLVNGSELFLSLIQQKKLKTDSFVNQTPFSSLKEDRDSSLSQPTADDFFWKQLPLLYQSFKEKLIKIGEGYQGLCYRMAQPSLEIMASYQELIFVGFNLLMPVEEYFIKQCHERVLTTFFWDADSHYLDNDNNLAGYHLREHRKKKWFNKRFSPVTYLNDPHKKVYQIEASSIVAQVQAVVVALQEKTDDGQPKFLPGQTAIVVSGSRLLIPLLDHFANLPIPLHTRLDYPFSATVIYTLVVRMVALWEASMATPLQQEIVSHLADVFALCHPFLEKACQLQLAGMAQLLEKHRCHGALYQVDVELFDCWLNKYHKCLLSYLQEGLTYIYNHFVATGHLFQEVNKAALAHLLGYIKELVYEKIDCSVSFFLNSLKERSVLFHKENPFKGLYIVDVTESYNLDFEHVFFLNMNEGHFPKLIPYYSLLPYDLRASFGLPFLDKIIESKVAYGFYRLLRRAQNIYFYCSQKNHLDSSSQISPLLIQLTFDSKLRIVKFYHAINVLEKSKTVISIPKDDTVMHLFNRFLVQEGSTVSSSLTPSALITYLSCPLQFYFKYLLQCKQTVLPKEGSEALQLGTLLHSVMASLYQSFVGKALDKKVIMELKSKIKIEINQAIAVHKKPLTSPILLQTVLEKLLERMLDVDDVHTPFTLLGVEVAINHPIVLNGKDMERKLSLGGVIDRIDRQNHCIRMVDYKTSLVNNKMQSIATLFDRTKIKQNKSVFQLFFYAWLFKSKHYLYTLQPIRPYLVSIQELFRENYIPGIFIQKDDDGKQYQLVEDITPYIEPFEKGLRALLSEIFNFAIPFVQTADHALCGYCPYVRICQRD